ncbi:hypothetical protein NHX12_026835, partial [Muraenolepis orangiensis]
MPVKPKKSTGSEETKEVNDEVEESEPKSAERRGKKATERERSHSRKHKSRESSVDPETPSTHTQPNKQKKNSKKGTEDVTEEKKKKKKKKKKKTSTDGGVLTEDEEDEDDGHEQNNNNVNTTGKSIERSSEQFPQEEVTKEEKKRKKKKCADPEKEDEMGSKDKKKKKKKPAGDDDEEALLEEQEGEEEEEDNSKSKKKKKKPKDDDDKKKKKKKSKQVDFAEIYQNELLNYNTDSSDGYEDEYYKKKVYEVVTVTGDVKGAGTDANVFVTLFGDFGVTPKVHLASKVVVTDINRPHLRFYFPCNNWLSQEEADNLFVRDLMGSLNPMDVHKWERRLDSDKDNFERGSEDKFTIDSPNLGRLRKITIGHNNRGSSAGWHLDKVAVDDMGNKEVYEFPVNRLFDTDEGDGKIQTDILVGSTQPMDIVYNVQVMTGDVRGAGTNSKIHIVMHGAKGLKNSGKVFLEGGAFERGLIDIFNVEICELISPLSRVTIGHDNRAVGAGWYCEKVTIYCPFTGIEQTFPCGKWLDEDEADGLIERELYEMVSLRQKKLKKYPWTLWIWTSDMKGAGTDAQVFLQIYGELGKSDEMRMENNSDSFEQGQVDKFMVTLQKTLTNEKYSFDCGRWLDINEDDNEIIRDIPATGLLIPEPLPLIKYHVTICTGNISGSGTDASVFLNVIGDYGDTGERLMFMSKNNVNKFEKGNHDEFLIESVSLGQVRRVRVGHDGRGGGCDVNYQITIMTGSINGASSDSRVFVKMYGEKGDTCKTLLMVSENDLSNYYETGRTDIFTVETFDIGEIKRLLIGHTNEGLRAGWFLDSVQISVPVHGKQYMFPSHRWLCKDEADGKVEVEIYPMINYEVTVTTGDRRAAGTNASVFCQIYGEDGKTQVLALQNRSNNFERGTTEIFKVEAHNVGKVYKIRIGHDGSGIGDGWFLEAVDIKRMTMAMVQVEVKVEPKKDKKKDKKKKKKEEDIEVEYIEELREVVEILLFPCNRWLARDEEDGEIVVELLPEDIEDLEINSYDIHVFTGSMWGAGTDANIYITIFGEEDIISITAVDMGVLKKLRIRQDNSRANAAWFLERVEIVDNKDDTTYYFPCKRWLAIDEDDGQIARELVPVDEAFMRKGDDDDEESSATLGLEQKAMSTTYTLKVKTGDKKYAGTDANVFIVLFGNKDDTGLINLKASKTHRNKFELGMMDEFIVEAVDIGPLKKLRIGHDNNGGGSAGWFLDWVEIDAPSLGQKLCFPCGRWLDTGEDDGAIVRDLFPNSLQTVLYTPYVPYEIKVFTSDLFGAGTDADVFIVLYGRQAVCTQQKSLCVNKRERLMYFERGAEDMFIVELEDVGDVIEKIRIGHDNRGVNPGWHMDRVEIRRLLRKGKGSETTIFPCECWLAKSEEDGETVRELVPSDIITEKLGRDGSLKVTEVEVEDALETHGYSVSVMTGDVYGAGTDANVFLTIYGDLGDTGERKLRKSETNSNKFERGSVDTFTIEAVDLGEVFKIKIHHDNSLMSPEWYLDQVEVSDLDTEEVFLFLCERWLSKKKEDRRISRFFYVKGYEGIRDSENSKKNLPPALKDVDIIPYHISVSTGTEQDSSTSSRAYVIIIGASHRQTDRLWLDLCDGRSSFEEGSLDSFECHGSDVGEIKKVELGHDGATPESCWLVDELSVAAPTKGVRYAFACKCWLAKDRGDGLTSRVFNVLDAETIAITQK